MTDQTKTQGPDFLGIFIAALGLAALVGLLAIPEPQWVSYLNWKPGTALLFHFGYVLPVLGSMVILYVLARLPIRSPHYLLPFVAAGAVWMGEGMNVARHVGYLAGIAKVDCWAPETRQCLTGKFERLEHLAAPKEPVVLTEKERQTYEKFMEVKARFEKSEPKSWAPEYTKWAEDYRAAMAEVFQGYPSAFKE